MKPLFSSAYFSVIFILGFIGFSSSEAPEEFPCKTGIALLMKRQLQGIEACANNMTFVNKRDRAAKITCILKCVLVQERIIPEDGVPTRAFLDAFIAREIPKNLLPKAKTNIGPCFDLMLDGKVDPKEENCKTYDPTIKCILNVLPNFCEEDTDKDKKKKTR